uniref:restriction endonuclease subunit S n=1 Tax=Gemmiger formicilis TaxID=745368 RepID=UPI003FF0FCB6
MRGPFTFAWEQRKVGDLLIERNQQAPMSDEYPLMAFIANEGVAPKGERYDRSALVTDTVNKLYKKTEKGDFIYSSNNLETGSIGLNKYGKACISPVYSIFEPTGIADSDFLGRRLVRKDFINAMVKWRQGVIYGQWRIHESDFLKIEITVPSVEEQRKIGTYLDQLDHLITLHQRKCANLCSPSQVVFSLLFVTSTFSWEQRKFSELVQIERGGSPRPIDDFITDAPNGLNWVKIGDAPTQGNYITKTAEKIRPEGLSKTREVHPGDLILSNSMSFGKPYIMGIDGCIHDGWLLIRNTYGVFDLTFLCHLLGTPQMLSQYRSLAAGSTVNNLNKELVGNTVVTIPSITEQRVLGDYLEQLDNLITLHQRECISFTGRADRLILTANKKRTTSSWEQRKLSELTSMHARIGWQNLRTSEFLDSGNYMLITGTDFNDGAINFSTCHYVERERYEQDRNIQIHNGSILITKDGTLGKVAYVQGLSMPATLNAGVFNVQIKDANNVDEKYLFQYLKAPFLMDYVDKKATGGTIKHLNQSILVDFPVILPQRSEQTLIGAFFQQLDNLITLHQRKPFLMKWRTSDANRNQTNRLVL